MTLERKFSSRLETGKVYRFPTLMEASRGGRVSLEEWARAPFSLERHSLWRRSERALILESQGVNEMFLLPLVVAVVAFCFSFSVFVLPLWSFAVVVEAVVEAAEAVVVGHDVEDVANAVVAVLGGSFATFLAF